MTIHIVQPALPRYRVPFFREVQLSLSERGRQLRVYASQRDHLGIQSVPASGFQARTDSTMSIHLGGQALWQSNLAIHLASGDILILNGNPRIISNYPLWARARLLGVPVVWWGHGWSAGSRGGLAKLRQWMMRFPDALLLYTDHERDDYVRMGFSPRRTFALNNGIDVESVDMAIAGWGADRLRSFRTEQGLDGRTQWCVFLGRLSAKSEVGLLIDALPAIRANIGLIVLGDGPAVADLRARASQLGVSSRILWPGAHFDEEILAPWMLSASAFVYPGAVGLSLIHGFAYGLPAVVHGTEKLHMPEIAAFEAHRNGMIFERGSALSLADAVNSLLANAPALHSMSMQATALVRKTFNVADMTRRFIELVDAIDRGLPSR